MDKSSVVKGKSIKTAIGELLCMLGEKKVSDSLWHELYSLSTLFLDDILYPSRIFDLVQEGIGHVKKSNDVSTLQKHLHYGCVYGIHEELASSETFVNKQVNSTTYNSESFYNQKIDALNAEKNALIQEVNDLKKKLNPVQKMNHTA